MIKPNERHIYTETIMDACPIATKVEGELGSGVTKVADGADSYYQGVVGVGARLSQLQSDEGIAVRISS